MSMENEKLTIKVNSKSKTDTNKRKLSTSQQNKSSVQRINRQYEKQALLPSKLTLTINFGTTENPKSRSRAKRPKSAISPRIGSTRKILESPLNDALVKYDGQEQSHENSQTETQIYFQIHKSRQNNTLRRYSDFESINMGMWRSNSNSRGSIAQNNDVKNYRKRRHSAVELSGASVATHKMAEALLEVQQQRPTSARSTPKKNPSGAWHSHHSSLLTHSTHAANDVQHVNYNYTFLKRPVSEMSPRFAKTMNRYKEDYKFLKSRLGGPDDLTTTRMVITPNNITADFASSITNEEEKLVNYLDSTVQKVEIHNEHDETNTQRSELQSGYSFAMQAFPTPRYILTRKEFEDTHPFKRPMSAASVKGRPSTPSLQKTSRPSSASTSRQRSQLSRRYVPSSIQAENSSGTEIFFSSFPPSKGISNQFFQGQRKNQRKRDHDEKISKLLSTSDFNSNQENDDQRGSSTQHENDQQDILDYYDRKDGENNRYSDIETSQNKIEALLLPPSVRAKLDETTLDDSTESAAEKTCSPPQSPSDSPPKESNNDTKREKNSALRIQTMRNHNVRRTVLSPSPVSPVLFNDYMKAAPPMGNLYDPAIYSPISSNSPAGTASSLLEDTPNTLGLSISEKIRLYDVIPSSPIARQSFSGSIGSIDISKSPSIIQRPNGSPSKISLDNVKLNSPSSPRPLSGGKSIQLFEYKEVKSDPGLAFQVARKEMSIKPPTEQASPESTTSPYSKQQNETSVKRRPKSGKPAMGSTFSNSKAGRKKRPIKIKTPVHGNLTAENSESEDTYQ